MSPSLPLAPSNIKGPRVSGLVLPLTSLQLSKPPLRCAGGLDTFGIGGSVAGSAIDIIRLRFIGADTIFIVLGDRSGEVQVLLSGSQTKGFSEVQQSSDLQEAVISVRGVVQARPANMINPKMSTGAFEVIAEECHILNRATKLPFSPTSLPLPDEEFRLQHRYIDLRRPELHGNIVFRAKLNECIRSFMRKQGFTEIETPLLFRSTPEGAREFLVSANRIEAGKVFALPQSPQQFKQMLMAAGFERYYQIARCFRDEDLRADRQPEFTQLDLELSFCTMEDVMGVVEGLVKEVWKELLGVSGIGAFPRMTYAEALSQYGSDKPDVRFAYRLRQLDQTNRHVVEALVFQAQTGSHEHFSLDSLSEDDWTALRPLIDRFDGQVLFCKGPDQISQLLNVTNLDPTCPDFTLCVRRDLDEHVGTTLLGRIRSHFIQRRLGARDTTAWRFLWVYDFPLLAKADAANTHLDARRQFESMHHPFTAPHPDDVPLLCTDPLAVRGQHYDLVLNGCEIAGGSIRIHSGELQEYLLRQVMQLPEATIHTFDHLLDALKSGCPPHGGIALGLDRIVAMMRGGTSIRDVIAFPKNSAGRDLCVKAPN